jgi:hypothetical protein
MPDAELISSSSNPRHNSQNAEMHDDGEQADGAERTQVHSDQESFGQAIVFATAYCPRDRDERNLLASASQL